MNKVVIANFAAGISSLSAGISIVATRFVITETDPLSLAFYRYFIAAVFLFPLACVALKRRPIKALHMIQIIILGIFLFTLFPWGFSAALNYTSAAYGAISLATMPIFTLIIAILFKKETLTNTKIVGVIIALAGVITATGQSLGDITHQNDDSLGIMLMILAAICAAIYSNFSKPLVLIYGPFAFTSFAMIAGMMVLFLISYFNQTLSITPEFSTMGWLTLLFLGIIGGALQFTSYTWALKWLSPAQAAIYLTLTPISAIFLAWPLLDEHITLEFFLGLVLVVMAIFLLNRPRKMHS